MSIRELTAVFALIVIFASLAPARASAVEQDDKSVPDTPVATTGRYVIEFSSTADLEPARSLDDRAARGRFVVSALQATARSDQRDALALARRLGVDATSYWLRNAMVVEGTDAQLAQLERLPNVASVRPEKVYPLVDPLPAEQAIAVAAGDPAWGVAKIGADTAWEDGIVGAGIVVANVDTGVDYSHPALVNQYRGNVGGGAYDHNYNWWDPTGICGATPCDNDGHGTHTMGTMVGGDGQGPFSPDIGVAPGARWIAAKGCEEFFCTEESLMSAGQFILAPTDLNGLNPDPARAPDIVNNSWGAGPGDPLFLATVQAWREAGIIPVFSSGNPGPYCGEGGSPGDYLESFSVGATDASDLIAEFSGRGPSAFGKVNPDVAAPGVAINSSLPGGTYGEFSGTSMAAPHTAGALALVLSAAGELVGDVEGALAAVRATAIDIIDLSCGGDADGDPNNVYGEGRIDAAAAVTLVATGGTLEGSISEADSGLPIAGARITAHDGNRTFTTSSAPDGTYKLFLAAGTYDVTASAFGYESVSESGVEIETDLTTLRNFSLTILPRAVISGRVVSVEAGTPIPGALVEALNVPVEPVITDATGAYSMELPLGLYSMKASNGGCAIGVTEDVTIAEDMERDFGLVSKIDQFGYGCTRSPQEWVDADRRFRLKGDDRAVKAGLPFSFPFYGDSYRRVWVTTNGYLTFDRPEFAAFFPSEIPSRGLPNSAIYALWTDLVVDDASQVHWTTFKSERRGPGAYVLEFNQLRELGGTATVDFEILLWSDGRIDTLYRNNASTPGNGRTATIGIENQTGSDAFQFSSRTSSLTENVGYRYQVVPTGFAAGVVTDLNDGLPVVGASVTAHPSGTTVHSGADGSYSIRLVPGDHSLSVSATHYVGQSADIAIAADETTTTDFVLAAGVARVSLEAIVATAELNAAASVEFDIDNPGSAPLQWSILERDRGATPPDLPPAPAPLPGLSRTPEWGLPAWATDVDPTVEVDYTGPFEPLITDPAGDAVGSADIGEVSGGANESELGLSISFEPGTPMDQTVGFMFLDTDQNPATGAQPIDWFGKETQDVGFEFVVDLFAAPNGEAYVIDTRTFSVVSVVPVETNGLTMTFAIPLEHLGDDGALNVATVMGDFEGPTDWAPDVGHGEIVPFRDAAWMTAGPISGELDPGEQTTVTVSLGGPGFAPGAYRADLAVLANDPRNPVQLLGVDLTIGLPDTFGSLAGTVSNGRNGMPVSATITVAAELDGQPFEVSAQADENTGQYLLFAPAGSWPVVFAGDGYETQEHSVAITAQFKTSLDVALLPLWPFASVVGGPLEFLVGAGETASLPLTLSNLEGLADLSFEILEVGDSLLAAPGAKSAERSGSSTEAPSGWVASVVDRQINGGSVAVFLDVLPWGSNALLTQLDAAGIVYDVLGSADMAAADLEAYEAVFISNDQPQGFYENYTAHRDRFETYVENGGFLWFGTAAWGFNGGDFSGGVLPGGVTVSVNFEEINRVAQPEHPVVAGVPDPFTGDAASHSAFANTPEGATLALGEWSGLPTLIDYQLGLGRVLGIGQPLEITWEQAADGAPILPNSIAYALGFDPFTDLPWLIIEPVSGALPPGGEVGITVTVDSSGLDPGTYVATVAIKTNDPLNRLLRVPVTLTVTE